MKKALLLVILFALNFLHLNAQKGVLTGTVTDPKSGTGLYGANIIIDMQAGLATVTDFDGNYSIDLEAGTYSVTYGYLGMEDQIIEVVITSGSTTTQNVTLSEKKELLDVVVVSATKYEANIEEVTVSLEVVGNNLLENNNIISIEEGLNKVPGVISTDRQINIRGGSGWSYGAGTRVMTLVDDMPMITADAGDVRWSSIPTENVRQIEVIKGAASALYGSSALNGIVNVRLAEPNATPYTRMTLYAGPYFNPRNKQSIWWNDSNRVHPFISGATIAHRRMIGDQVGLVAGANFISDMSYKNRASYQEGRITTNWFYKPKQVKNLRFGVDYTHNYGKGYTFFLWDGIDTSQLLPLPGSASDYKNQRMNVDFTVDYFDSKKNKYVFRSRYYRTVNKNNTNQGNVGNLYFGEFQYQKRIFKAKYSASFTTGFAASFSDVKPPPGGSVEESLVGKHTGYNLAPYVQGDFKFFNNTLNFSVGARYEYFKVDSFKSDALPVVRFGLSYQIKEGSNIRASWGQGYRFPSLAEKFVSTNVGGIGIFPNPRLEAESGWSAEIGFKQQFKNKAQTWIGYADISGFLLRYEDMMEFTFGQFAPGFTGIGFSAQNVGQTIIGGFEFSAFSRGQIGKFPLEILMGYTYIVPKSLNWNDTLTLYDVNGNEVEDPGTYAETSTSEENILKYRSTHNFKIDIQSSWNKLDFGGSLIFTSWQENIDRFFVDGAIALEPFIGTQAFSGLKEWRERFNGRGTTQIDLRIAYNFTPTLKLAVIAKNILNMEYMERPAELQDPTNIVFQFNWQF